MEPILQNMHLKFPTHGSMTQIWVRFFLKNYTKLSLLAHTTFKSHWNLFLVIISRLQMASFCYNIGLKFWSEQIQDGQPPPSCWHCTITYQWNPLLSHFWIRTWHFCKIMMSLEGIPGISHGFILISYQNVRSDTLIKSNNTCFVQNFIKI